MTPTGEPRATPSQAVTRELRRPRIAGVKGLVPASVKRGPKALQAQALTAVARAARRNVDPADAILVVSSPRSGSTWLFEMLASDRSVLPVFEPFHPTHNPVFAPLTDDLGFLTRPAAARASSAAHLVREVAAGRRLTRWSANRARRDRILWAPRTLVKEVRVGAGLPWLVEVLPVPTILLVRHPCAVVESMLRSPGEWQQWPLDVVRHSLLERGASPDLVATLEHSARAEHLAALWAVDTRIALDTARSHDHVRVVFYETMVRRPGEVLAELSDVTRLGDLQADADRLSLHTHKGSPLRDRNGNDPLANWTKHLDEDVATRVLHTAHAFDVTLYAQDLEPAQS
jgi:Sulfotransferase family